MAENESDTVIESSANGTRFNVGFLGGSEPRASNRNSRGSDTSADETVQSSESGFRAPVRPIKSRRSGKKTDATVADGAAHMIVGVVETLGVSRYGPPAGRMQDHERKMLHGGIKQSLMSLPIEVADQVNSISAPVMALAGLMLYAIRMSQNERVLHAARQQQAANTAVNQATQVVREHANGSAPDLSTLGQGAPPSKDDLMDQFGH